MAASSKLGDSARVKAIHLIGEAPVQHRRTQEQVDGEGMVDPSEYCLSRQRCTLQPLISLHWEGLAWHMCRMVPGAVRGRWGGRNQAHISVGLACAHLGPGQIGPGRLLIWAIVSMYAAATSTASLMPWAKYSRVCMRCFFINVDTGVHVGRWCFGG